jgi:hypothetical protein
LEVEALAAGLEGDEDRSYVGVRAERAERREARPRRSAGTVDIEPRIARPTPDENGR